MLQAFVLPRSSLEFAAIRRAAEEIARKRPGVVTVIDELKVGWTTGA